ncbi:hypothetical protein P4374_24765, partial [Bacillus thuringiensis]|nr:hypothetical protein [Bacillus thuringiensis]
ARVLIGILAPVTIDVIKNPAIILPFIPYTSSLLFFMIIIVYAVKSNVRISSDTLENRIFSKE